MMVMANDQAIAHACASGSLELNAFMPLIADALLGSLDLLTSACSIFRRLCVEGIEANVARCGEHVMSSTAIVTALVEKIGYEKATHVAHEAQDQRKTIRQIVLEM